MRVRGRNDGRLGGGGRRNRSTSFRRGRTVGQRVRGRVLTEAKDGMAWVEIEGHRLLAQLGSSPPVDSHLSFVIQQLTPQIVLKALLDFGGASNESLQQANSFEAARALFENGSADLFAALQNTPPRERPNVFFSTLKRDVDQGVRYLDAAICLSSVSSGADVGPLLLYQPWRMPEGRRHATVIKPPAKRNELLTVIAECELPGFGLTQVECLHKGGVVGVRILTQYPGDNEALKRHLSRQTLGAGGAVNLLGVFKLPEASHGGLLTQYVFNT